MSIFNKQSNKKEESKQDEKKEIKKDLKNTSKKEVGNFYQFLIEPLLTEKGTILRESGQYLFKVATKANKIEIKNAIENIFNTKVDNVNIVNIPRKKRRLGKSQGFKAGYKKAIVTLKKGEKIEEI